MKDGSSIPDFIAPRYEPNNLLIVFSSDGSQKKGSYVFSIIGSIMQLDFSETQLSVDLTIRIEGNYGPPSFTYPIYPQYLYPGEEISMPLPPVQDPDQDPFDLTVSLIGSSSYYASYDKSNQQLTLRSGNLQPDSGYAVQFSFRDRNPKYPMTGYEVLPVRIIDSSLEKPQADPMSSATRIASAPTQTVFDIVKNT